MLYVVDDATSGSLMRTLFGSKPHSPGLTFFNGHKGRKSIGGIMGRIELINPVGIPDELFEVKDSDVILLSSDTHIIYFKNSDGQSVSRSLMHANHSGIVSGNWLPDKIEVPILIKRNDVKGLAIQYSGRLYSKKGWHYTVNNKAVSSLAKHGYTVFDSMGNSINMKAQFIDFDAKHGTINNNQKAFRRAMRGI